MPMRAPRLCGCGKTVAHGQMCDCQRARKQERDKAHDAKRPSSSARGYTSEWERESKRFLRQPENRLCACGCGRASDMVDHKVRHRGSPKLFWDRSNWQAMNSHCHNSRKQAVERRTQPGGWS